MLLACGLLRSRLRFGVFAAEAFDASRGVYQLLLAGEERVASGADFDVDVALVRGAGDEAVAARAEDANLVVIRVDSGFGHNLFETFPAISLFYVEIGDSSMEEAGRFQFESFCS